LRTEEPLPRPLPETERGVLPLPCQGRGPGGLGKERYYDGIS